MKNLIFALLLISMNISYGKSSIESAYRKHKRDANTRREIVADPNMQPLIILALLAGGVIALIAVPTYLFSKRKEKKKLKVVDDLLNEADFLNDDLAHIKYKEALNLYKKATGVNACGLKRHDFRSGRYKSKFDEIEAKIEATKV